MQCAHPQSIKEAAMSTSIRDLVAAAKSEVRNLSVDQFAGMLDGDAVTLLDVREPDEVLRDGAIPGAVQAPRGMLEFWADPASPYHRDELQPDRRTLLYCASGGRSALAAQALQNLGYVEVAHLEGGFKAWRELGRPVTRQAS
jgi:rhodanese-related sulfurtransferase